MEQDTVIRFIQKGMDNGYKPAGVRNAMIQMLKTESMTGEVFVVFKKRTKKGMTGFMLSLTSLLFDRNLAKAVWGKDWKVHIQQLAIDDDPIDYLEQFLEEGV